jgi:hypothetical protein
MHFALSVYGVWDGSLTIILIAIGSVILASILGAEPKKKPAASAARFVFPNRRPRSEI